MLDSDPRNSSKKLHVVSIQRNKKLKLYHRLYRSLILGVLFIYLNIEKKMQTLVSLEPELVHENCI